ncbi:hypothetical protein F66182_14532 [Fusarium sp. NRRL 66182]|nr:hypothetical protein F66182_14532 [Fusarium sp. NRRL 66182]
MVFIARFLTLVLTATATSILRRDVGAIETDITQKISPQLTTLSNDVNGYPASGLSGALAIDRDFRDLIAIVNNATTDVKSSGDFSEADGSAVLQDVEALVPTFSDTMAALASQAPAWTNLPGGQALVLSDLQGLNATSVTFIDALTAASPVDLVPAFLSVRDQIQGALDSAIAAYYT